MNIWRVLSATAALVIMGAISPAMAQPSTGDTQNGRYAMTPAPGGFLRMDTRTGAVSLCSLRDGNVTCASSTSDRGAADAEVARLAKENADLRERLAQVTQKPGIAVQPQRGGLPSADEMDKALGFAETFMRRMMRIMREEAPGGNKL